MSGAISYTYTPPLMPGMLAFLVRSDALNTTIPCDLGNRDYQAFLAWIAEGNAAPEGWTGPTNPADGTA